MMRPKLAPHARYRWDAIRQQHQLVIPEGLLTLNDSAAALVVCCDGRTTEEVLKSVVGKFDGTKIAEALRFLKHLHERGLIRDVAP